MEFGTLEGILGCIAVGLGWTLMPRRVVEQSAHAADLVIESVPPDIATVPTGMIRAARRPGAARPAHPEPGHRRLGATPARRLTAPSGLEQLLARAEPALQVLLGQSRMLDQHGLGHLARHVDQIGIQFQIGIAQQRHAALPPRRIRRTAICKSWRAISKPSVFSKMIFSRWRAISPAARHRSARNSIRTGRARPAPQLVQCDSPKRSACSITIRLALGTSTPTSITVVATSTSMSPAAKAAITACFSSAFSRPCTSPTRSSGKSCDSCS
jgi:hypothetical protein